jgi:hypothetical protein
LSIVFMSARTHLYRVIHPLPPLYRVSVYFHPPTSWFCLSQNLTDVAALADNLTECEGAVAWEDGGGEGAVRLAVPICGDRGVDWLLGALGAELGLEG